MSYSIISAEHRQGLQLFEVPNNDENCKEYCGKGYGNNKGVSAWWVPTEAEGWIQLPNNTDFSCKMGFEKVFCYAYEVAGNITHCTRQWGDGTILSKMGQTRDGATPVYRVMDPQHPSLVEAYGPVHSTWIRPYQNGTVPVPFFRGQSTFQGGPVYFCKSWQNIEQVREMATLDWKVLLEELKSRRAGLEPVIELQDGLSPHTMAPLLATTPPSDQDPLESKHVSTRQPHVAASNHHNETQSTPVVLSPATKNSAEGTQQKKVFEAIYSAMYGGETTFFKCRAKNFADMTLEQIKTYADANPKSRTHASYKIYEEQCSHSNDNSHKKENVFKKIHEHCVSNSGWFSKTKNKTHDIEKGGKRSEIIRDKLTASGHFK